MRLAVIISCFVIMTAHAASLPSWATSIHLPSSQPHPASTITSSKKNSLLHKIAIFGKDSRQSVPQNLGNEKEQIGLLFNPRNSTLCTAFCVAPNVIATASHCLFRKNRSSRNRLSNFIFRLGSGTKQTRDTRLSGYKTRQVHHYIVAGTTYLRKKPPIGAALDWSLVRLAKPNCHSYLKVKRKSIYELELASEQDKIFQLAYHQDYKNWNMAYSKSCKIRREFGKLAWKKITRQFKNPSELILHRCDTGGASSGSPILERTKDGVVAVGINVGTYQQRNLLMEKGRVIKRSRFHTIANTAVNASAFSQMIPLLKNAKILTDPLDIIELQSNLKNQNYLRGRADGIFGSKTEKAIKAYERQLQLPPIGLPTRKILNALRNVNIIQRGRASMSSSVVPKRR